MNRFGLLLLACAPLFGACLPGPCTRAALGVVEHHASFAVVSVGAVALAQGTLDFTMSVPASSEPVTITFAPPSESDAGAPGESVRFECTVEQSTLTQPGSKTVAAFCGCSATASSCALLTVTDALGSTSAYSLAGDADASIVVTDAAPPNAAGTTTLTLEVPKTTLTSEDGATADVTITHLVGTATRGTVELPTKCPETEEHHHHDWH